MSWFMHHAVLFALLCAAAAVAYGLGLTVWLLRRPAGTERMQEISRAVQEGAAAYLRRQYTTIAIVAIVPFLALGLYHSLGWGTAIGFLIGATLSAAAGFIGMNVAVRSNVRTAEAARTGLPAALNVAFRAGSVTGPARRRPRPLRRRRLLLGAHRLAQPHAALGDPRPDRPRLRRLAHLGLRAARRRHLHEGRGRRRRPRRQDRGGHPGGRSAQPGRDRGQRRRQRRRLRRHGRRPVRDVRGDRGRGDAARRHGRGVRHRHAPLALPARDRRRLDHRLDHRRPVRARPRRRQRDERALPRRARRNGHLRRDLHPGDEGLRPERQVLVLAPLRLGADRPRGDGAARRDHRVLHGHALEPGEEDLRPPRSPGTRRTSSKGSRSACRRPPRR